MKPLARMMLALLGALSLPADLGAAPMDLLNPPQGRFLDEWAEVYMAGGKVGYMHSSTAREADRIVTNSVSRIRLGRVDSPIAVEIVQTTTETVEGAPIAFTSEMSASTIKTATKGTIENGRVTVITAQYGIQNTQTYEYPPGALMVWGLTREGLRRGFQPGTEYTLQAYTPEIRFDGPVTTTTKIGEWEDIEHNDRRLRGQRTTVVMALPTGALESVSWVDENGRPVKAVIPVPGLGDMVMLATDQATALADFIPPELFMKTTIPAGRPIDAKRADRIVYRIRSKEKNVELSGLPSTDMQTVTKPGAESIELVLTRLRHERVEPQANPGAVPLDAKSPGSARADAPPAAVPAAAELVEYLEPNLLINTDDPELVSLAKKAAQDERDPYVLADQLRRFVTEYVQSKTLNIGFATASEVCRTREGDCSEHAVLLAALGRLNGLPSRVAVGVAYVPKFGGQENIFGYHMWTQFRIDGRWIDVDAALRETDCSPTRIAFATSSLRNTGLADLSLPLLSKIGAIEIDILDIEYGNR